MITHGDLHGWNENKRYRYQLSPDDTVLDLGSHKGCFSKRIKTTYKCNVIEFDPSLNLCAWTHNGFLNIGGSEASASFLSKGKDYKCVDICNYLNEKIGLMKINIEGGEYDLMDHILNSGLQVNVRNFQIQFHVVTEMDYIKRYNAIAEILQQTHFLTWQQPFVWENWQIK